MRPVLLDRFDGVGWQDGEARLGFAATLCDGLHTRQGANLADEAKAFLALGCGVGIPHRASAPGRAVAERSSSPIFPQKLNWRRLICLSSASLGIGSGTRSPKPQAISEVSEGIHHQEERQVI